MKVWGHGYFSVLLVVWACVLAVAVSVMGQRAAQAVRPGVWVKVDIRMVDEADAAADRVYGGMDDVERMRGVVYE